VRTLLANIRAVDIDWQGFFIKIFQLLEITVIVVGWMGSSLLIQQYDTYRLAIEQIGNFAGSAAIFLYSMTLVPGILKRLKVKPEYTVPLANLLVIFRRRMGILMFLLLFVHLLFIFILPAVIQEGLHYWYEQIWQGQIWGLTALILLIPLWITSNDLAIELLGNWRHMIHRLTYIIMIFIFLHAVYIGSIWAVLLLLQFIVLVISWIRYWQVSSQE